MPPCYPHFPRAARIVFRTTFRSCRTLYCISGILALAMICALRGPRNRYSFIASCNSLSYVLRPRMVPAMYRIRSFFINIEIEGFAEFL